MKINKESWIYRAYENLLDSFDWFNLRDYHDREIREHTDLCRFVRMFVIWLPYMIFLNLAAIAYMFMAFIWQPILYLGAGLYCWGSAVAVGVAFGIAGFAYGCIVVSEKTPPKWWLKFRDRAERRPKKREPGVVSIAVAYLKAKKSKVCPFIEFTR